MATTAKETPQAAVDESQVQELVGLLKESVAAYRKVGPDEPTGAEYRLYSYVRSIEGKFVNELPRGKRLRASSQVWGAVGSESCDVRELAAALWGLRVPEKVCAELVRRIAAYNLALQESMPTYDAVFEFLGLEWALDGWMAGPCDDPVDEEFLDSTLSDDEITGGYEYPIDDVATSIAMGPATADEARRLIALAQAVNTARAEWRRKHESQAA